MKNWGCTANIEIQLRGPILVHGNDIGPRGADAIAMRDHEGRLVISGDAIQGKLRESFDEIASHDPFQRSRKSDVDVALDNSSKLQHEDSLLKNLQAPNTPYPLFLSDFLCNDSGLHPPAAKTLASIKIDSETGVTSDKMLRFLDCPVDPGRIVTFRGTLRFLASSQNDAKKILDEIVRGLQWVPQFGSQGSVGFGRVQSVKCSAVDFQDLVKLINLGYDKISADRICVHGTIVDYSLSDLLCVPDRLVNKNTYESRDEIPGEVLKGAVARLIQAIYELPPESSLEEIETTSDTHLLALCRRYRDLRFTTARPIEKNSKPTGIAQVLPLSLAEANGKIFDFTNIDQDDVLFNDAAAAFAPDWKPAIFEVVNNHFAIAQPAQELRVRTAIDSSHRRARRHSLFAYRCVQTHQHDWRGTVSTVGPSEDSADPQLVQALRVAIAVLNTGWLSIGKMRARTRGTVVGKLVDAIAKETCSPVVATKERVVVTLRSQTLMIDPRQCVNPDGTMKDQLEIDALFATYWDEVSGGLWQEAAQGRFMQTSLIGGFQAYKYRFSPETSYDLRNVASKQDRMAEQKKFPYQPTMVVEPGSVFVLQLKPHASDLERRTAMEKLFCWQTQGLPLPTWAEKAYGDTYHTNIFLQQNGFGELDVNLPCHDHAYDNPLCDTMSNSDQDSTACQEATE